MASTATRPNFDLVTSLATPEELRLRLPKIELLQGARPEPVWRSKDFARFEIGRLSDGREEWLEFWLQNHLLADFDSLKARAEIGTYGGEQVAFLSIADLLRSKETERESDWQDIALLEEIQDARHFASLGTADDSLHRLLADLRSRRGMDRVIDNQLAGDKAAIAKAISASTHHATYAFLVPLAPDVIPIAKSVLPEFELVNSMRLVTFGSPKHFAFVEICRRKYKRLAIERDRSDKQAKLLQG